MTISLSSRIVGQTPLGLYTNLWPTALNRRDRQAMGCWYVVFHVGPWTLDFTSVIKQRKAIR